MIMSKLCSRAGGTVLRFVGLRAKASLKKVEGGERVHTVIRPFGATHKEVGMFAPEKPKSH